jgi:exopolysaccharide biosynthesis polyprenyl glycosylphosphotransferase
MQRRKKYIFAYIVLDALSAFIAWVLLYYFRKFFIELEPGSVWAPLLDKKFFIGLIVIPLIWVTLYYLSGIYTDVFRKSRLKELIITAFQTLVGSVVIFFLFLLDDLVKGYKDYYLSFGVLLIAHFAFTASFRILFLNHTKKLLYIGKVNIKALIAGTDAKISELKDFFATSPDKSLSIVGVVSDAKNGHQEYLGHFNQLDDIIEKNDIEEVFVAIETEQHNILGNIINKVGDKNVHLKIVPDMYDILSRTVKMNHVMGEAFIEIPPTLIEEWQRIQKRLFDIIFSSVALFFSAPIIAFTIIRIKRDSPGPLFFKQERLGQFGRPFMMYKLRSMHMNAEAQGPKLSSDDDNRITAVCKWIRRYRIDELPQFWNVLKGEMSLVGPRAERAFFAHQIEAKAPHYTHVLKVKPGITSLGMVKYGYASNLDQMIARLRYDIIYIENMSMMMDLKILFYTVATVLGGKGK